MAHATTPRFTSRALVSLQERRYRCPLRLVAVDIEEKSQVATTPQTVYEPHAGAPSPLQEKARRHLWMHFTRMGAYDDQHEIPIIVRGEGSYVFDEHDKRYLDGLSALFCVNAGHGRAEIGEAAAAQAKKLGFYTNWSYAHPRAIELATRVAALTPGDLNRVFFTDGGSEAVESAWKLARNWFRMRGEG